MPSSPKAVMGSLLEDGEPPEEDPKNALLRKPKDFRRHCPVCGAGLIVGRWVKYFEYLDLTGALDGLEVGKDQSESPEVQCGDNYDHELNLTEKQQQAFLDEFDNV